MLISKLKTILAEKGIKISRVFNDTGISRSTLTALAENQSKGIQFETLNTLCNYLKVNPGELFSYVPFDFEVNIDTVTVDNANSPYYNEGDFNVSAIGNCDITVSLFINVKFEKGHFSLEFIGKGSLQNKLINIEVKPIEDENEETKRVFYKVYDKLDRSLETHLGNLVGSEIEKNLDGKRFESPGDYDDFYIPVDNPIHVTFSRALDIEDFLNF